MLLTKVRTPSVPQAESRQRDIDFGGEGFHPGDTLEGAFGVPLFSVAVDVTGQGHDPVIHLDADLGGVNGWAPLQFRRNVCCSCVSVFMIVFSCRIWRFSLLVPADQAFDPAQRA